MPRPSLIILATLVKSTAFQAEARRNRRGQAQGAEQAFFVRNAAPPISLTVHLGYSHAILDAARSCTARMVRRVGAWEEFTSGVVHYAAHPANMKCNGKANPASG
jgi:hypothetical protein